jgi:hypothetical protein
MTVPFLYATAFTGCITAAAQQQGVHEQQERLHASGSSSLNPEGVSRCVNTSRMV